MERLRPDDHFLVLLEGDETPMHIGSLLVLDCEGLDTFVAIDRLRSELIRRLPRTPLLRRLVRAPLGFDSDVWVGVDPTYLADHADDHIVVHDVGRPLSPRDLDAFVERRVMVALDLTRPPFSIDLLGPVEAGRIAAYVRVHHCLTDGVGFQTLLGLLGDQPPDVEVPPLEAPDQLPGRHEWLRQSIARFRDEAGRRAAAADARRAAMAALRSPELARSPTPTLGLSGPTSARRAYARRTLPFDDLHAVARRLEATINDVYLALVGTAVRAQLIEVEDLPDVPLTVNAARSYRRPEHGPFGNRIVAIHPHLGTDRADPIERLRSIQASMSVERRRTEHEEALLDALETPFGPAVRRRRFAARRSGTGTIIPGNVTVSNVPGPAEVRTFAGMPQVSNHPTPLLGSGRALNFTARRNAGAFDVGVMADPVKIADVEAIASRFVDAFELYRSLASATDLAARQSGDDHRELPQ